MPTPTDLIIAAQAKIASARTDLAESDVLLEQAKAALVPPAPAVKYHLTVVNGVYSGDYEAGSIVPITADALAGQKFVRWSDPVADPTSPTTTVTMPANPLTVAATYVPVVTPVPSDKLLQAADLVYQGAFRVPRQPSATGRGLDSGGTALAYNAEHNSLFLVGHPWDQLVGEITIPTLAQAATVDGLKTATFLQTLTDATDGKLSSVGTSPSDTVLIGGLLPYQGKLYVTAYLFYDASGVQKTSHFVSGLDLRIKGDVAGPFAVGPLGAGMMSGYFGLVPAAWQTALGGPVLNGNSCLSIIDRTSYGPCTSGLNPTAIGMQPSPASPLVYYTSAHKTLGWQTNIGDINGTTQVKGIVFPEGTSSVLFFGRQGIGKICYGEASACGNDTAETSKGAHAQPYKYFVWAYNANDLAAVKAGAKQPWDVKPYATWALTLPFVPGDDNQKLLGATYDPATGRIFVSQSHGDGAYPVIHVFTVS